jgi:hypothetical protein
MGCTNSRYNSRQHHCEWRWRWRWSGSGDEGGSLGEYGPRSKSTTLFYSPLTTIISQYRAGGRRQSRTGKGIECECAVESSARVSNGVAARAQVRVSGDGAADEKTQRTDSKGEKRFITWDPRARGAVCQYYPLGIRDVRLF